MSTTATDLAPWLERNPESHPGSPGSYESWLRGVVVLSATERAILVARPEAIEKRTWVSFKALRCGSMWIPSRHQVRDILCPVWLYRKLRDELK